MQQPRDSTEPAVMRADAFRAAIVERRVALDIGSSLPPLAGGEVPIVLSRRVLMDAATVARLISALRDVVGRQGPRWGAPEAQPPAPSLAPTPSHAEPTAAGRQAALLLQLVQGLDCPHFHERSFRITEGSLAANRFLLTVNTRSIPGDVRQGVVGICRRIDMPADLLRQVEDGLADAKAVHFGFEGDGRVLFKVYLERRDAYDESEAAAPGTPVLMHVAYKWDSEDPAHRAVSRYHWYPRLDVAAIAARLQAIYGDAASPSLAVARSVLETAAAGMNLKGLQYLEVGEEGNPRRSFDLNVYNAGLQIRELQPVFSRMRERFGIRPGAFQALFDQVKPQILGHLAGGIHRDGRDFFNVYYGVQRYRG
jgi:tryptophan halogenase